MSKPSNTPAIIGVALLSIGGLVLINKASLDSRPKTQQEMEAEEQAKQTPASSTPVSQEETSKGSDSDLVVTGDLSAASGDGKKTLTLGYSWTPEVQANPRAIEQGMTMMKTYVAQKGMGFRTVNVDANPSVPDGLSIDGKQLAPLPENGVPTPEWGMTSLQQLGGK
jgi:hypothetical protein